MRGFNLKTKNFYKKNRVVFARLLASSVVWLLPVLVLAAETGYVPLEGSITGGQNVANFGDYLKRVYEIGITVTIVLAVLYLVIGGFGYMTSSTSITDKEGAKNKMTNAILGLLLALLSYVILNTISPQFTKFSLNISEVGKSFNTVPATGAGGTVGVGGVTVTGIPVKDGVCPNGVCKADPVFVEKAQKFVAIVGKDAGQFTEIGSYSYQGHSAECHKASPPTCGDYNFPPGVKPTANNINFITDSAQKAGGRAVYEVGTKEEADQLKLAGVKSVIYVPPKDGKPGVTAPHFSFYSI